MNFIISAGTDAGITRKINQDSLYAGIMSAGDDRMVFAVLCDGMGGLKKGEVASASVIMAYRKWAMEQLPHLMADRFLEEAIRREWCELAVRCNDRIRRYGAEHAIRLGSTAVVMLITEWRYYLMNIGDSRAYEISDACRQLTQDQTVTAWEVRMGLLTPEQAGRDPRRNVLLQCVGAADAVYPDFFFGDTRRDAVYMLCSDGFRHEISADEMYEYLHPARLQSVAAMRANEQALIALNRQRHEKDNISVVTIRTC